MNRSQLGQVPQQSVASNASPVPLMPSGKWSPLPVIHELQEHGAIVPLINADYLHVSIMGVPNVLIPSFALQIALGVGELDLRKKARTILARMFWGMNTDRPADPRIVVYNNRNSYTVFFTLRDQWSVSQEFTLTWRGRTSLVLTRVGCQTTIDVPDPERDHCAAWFEGQRVRLENHFAKRLAQAPVRSGARA